MWVVDAEPPDDYYDHWHEDSRDPRERTPIQELLVRLGPRILHPLVGSISNARFVAKTRMAAAATHTFPKTFFLRKNAEALAKRARDYGGQRVRVTRRVLKFQSPLRLETEGR